MVTGNSAPRINPYWPGNKEIPPSEYVNVYMDPANLDFRPKGSTPIPPPVGQTPSTPVPPVDSGSETDQPVEEPEVPVGEPKEEPTAPADTDTLDQIDAKLAELSALVAALRK